jgi:hypothetical protein
MSGIKDFRHSLASVGFPLTDLELEALAFIAPLSPDYPGIDEWFRTKVVPGLRVGTRTIFRVDRLGSIAAIGIAKADSDELKICTVRVAPSYVGRGMGLRVFDHLLLWLGSDRPHATVSDAKMPQFERIFDRLGFRLTSVHGGLYAPASTEFFFNEEEHLF